MKGLGNDLIEIQRVQEGFDRHGQPFLDKLFTEKEQAFCREHADPFPRFAGRFAAKEAIAKALGCGFGEHLSFHDVEILPDTSGKPIAHLSDAVKEKFNSPEILITISHNKTMASSVAVWIE